MAGVRPRRAQRTQAYSMAWYGLRGRSAVQHGASDSHGACDSQCEHAAVRCAWLLGPLRPCRQLANLDGEHCIHGTAWNVCRVPPGRATYAGMDEPMPNPHHLVPALQDYLACVHRVMPGRHRAKSFYCPATKCHFVGCRHVPGLGERGARGEGATHAHRLLSHAPLLKRMGTAVFFLSFLHSLTRMLLAGSCSCPSCCTAMHDQHALRGAS